MRCCSFQAHHELCGMAAPIDRDDERADVLGCDHFLRLAGHHCGHRDHEILAEIPPCVAGDCIGDLPDQVAHVLLGELSFAHAHQHDREHWPRGGEIDDAAALARYADEPRELLDGRPAFLNDVRRTHRGRLVGGRGEVVCRAFDEGFELHFGHHYPSPLSSSSRASVSWRSVNGLHRKPLAPFLSASMAVALSESAEITRMRTSGLIFTRFSTHSMPSISGIVISMVTTSAGSLRKASTACLPFAAVATTCSLSICSSRSILRRMMFESSQIMSLSLPFVNG